MQEDNNIAEDENKKLSWVKTKPAELQKIVVELAKQGNSPAQIGLILRDKYGIPKAKLLGKRISKILKEADIKYITEKDIIEKNVEKLKEHMKKNKYDTGASRSITKKLWRIRQLTQQH